MNKIKVIFLILTSFVLINSCEDTNENLVQQRGKGATPIMTEPVPAFFTDDLANSLISFNLSLPEGQTVDQAWIEVGFEGKKEKISDIASFPLDVIITAREVISKLGINESDVNLGDVFDVAVVTVVNGITTHSLAAVPVSVTCALEPDLTVGAYSFESADWEIAGNLTLEADPANPNKIYIIGYPEAEGLSTGNGNRIELNINPNTFGVSGPKVVLADDLSEWGLPYTNYAYEVKSGSYNSCTGTYRIVFGITVDQGSFGNNVFIFTPEQ
jgi:hypothetical protein